MRKYFFIASILIAFTALAFNSPVIDIPVDKQETISVDDTTKAASKTKVTSKEPAKKCCSSKSTKSCSEKGDTKTSKEATTAKACCKTVKKK